MPCHFTLYFYPPDTHHEHTRTLKYAFMKTRIQSGWKSSLVKQWTNMTEIQSNGKKVHSRFDQRTKSGFCAKILYLNLANFLQFAPSDQENGKDTHGQLCCLVDDATVACSVASFACLSHVFYTDFSVVHSIKFASTILYDGCSQPLKMQEGHQTTNRTEKS